MGCLTVKYTRKGGIEAEAERIGGITCTATRVGGIIAKATRIGGMAAKMTRVGGGVCRFALVCTPGLLPPYLEINPTILWVYPDLEAYNDVYSNTRWNVD